MASGSSVWRGDTVLLRGFSPDDWEYFLRFEEDSDDARAVFRVVPPRAPETHRKEVEQLAAESNGEDEFALAVASLETGQPVGAISTFAVDHRSGRFKYGLAIERSHRRRGYATDAARILLRYMFDERRFHKCEIDVHEFNGASIALHQGLGFSSEGRLRDHEYFRGRHYDVIVMGITAPEFRAG